MENTNVFVAHFKFTTQIGPYDYDVITITKICTKETTIGELEEWYRIYHSGNCYFGISQATQLELPKKKRTCKEEEF